MDADETVIYNFATELLNTKQVGDGTFKAVKDKFGEKGNGGSDQCDGLLPVGIDAVERRSISAAGRSEAELQTLK